MINFRDTPPLTIDMVYLSTLNLIAHALKNRPMDYAWFCTISGRLEFLQTCIRDCPEEDKKRMMSLIHPVIFGDK